MNEKNNKFLLAGDKFMPDMHLRQPGFTYSPCRPFTKNKERIQKFKKTGDSRYIYQNELDKVYFQHDMACGDFKDFPRRTAADKVLCDKTFNIAKKTKYDGYQTCLDSIVYKRFHKKFSGSGVKRNFIPNQRPLDLATQELAAKLHKPIMRKFEKRKVYSSFIDNICDANFADINLISKFNK